MVTFQMFYEAYNKQAHADFSVVETTSPEKLKVIEWENQLFKQSVPTRKKNEAVLGVVGNDSQLLRHIEQYRDLGFREENMYICEIQQAAWQGLVDEAVRLESEGIIKKTNLSERIYNHDIFEIATEIPNLTHIDFDETRSPVTLEDDVEYFYTICEQLKTLCVVKTIRQVPDVTLPAEVNPLLQVFSRDLQNLPNATRLNYTSSVRTGIQMVMYGYDRVEIILNRIYKNFPQLSVMRNSYKSKPTMVSFIFTTEGNWPEDQTNSQQNTKRAQSLIVALRRIHTIIVETKDYDAHDQFKSLVATLKNKLASLRGQLTPFQLHVSRELAKFDVSAPFLSTSKVK